PPVTSYLYQQKNIPGGFPIQSGKTPGRYTDPVGKNTPGASRSRGENPRTVYRSRREKRTARLSGIIRKTSCPASQALLRPAGHGNMNTRPCRPVTAFPSHRYILSASFSFP